MEFLKRSWQQVHDQVRQWPANVKWLIGVSLICMIALLLLVLTFAGSPSEVPIEGFASNRPGEVEMRLRTAGVKVRLRDGQIMVPSDQRWLALQILASSDLMSDTAFKTFDKLIEGSLWQSNRQFAVKEKWARQEVLAQIIATFSGVRSANVVLDIPDGVGFGRSHVRPSASVNVIMDGSRRVDRRMVEAIAGLVSSAVASMKIQDVVVIDANEARQFTVKEMGEFGPEDALAAVQESEQYHQGKISEHLHYIRGVIVTVNVQIEPVGAKTVSAYEYESTETLKSQDSTTKERRNQRQDGEPGTRSNVGANIASTGGDLDLETEETERTEYDGKPMVQQSQTRMVGQTTKKINVSISVPSSFIQRSFDVSKGGAADAAGGDVQNAPPAPDGAFVKAELAKIEQGIQPIIDTLDHKGDVNVGVFNDGPMREALAAQLAGPAGFVARFGDWVRPAGLGLLVLTAVGLMLTMVRKATHNPSLPTAQELAGVPPILPDDEDLIGEAEESEAAMPGLELDEESVRARQVAEQISELIKEKPEEAAILVGKWVEVEE
ncbi:MAG: hypothetical protein CMJ18_20860 [Phycisphaeraceae bacterium]|nr:hypothetical protein [Phycisphaeraceae bacterium]